MPLFECTKCKTIDNTALDGNYWMAQLNKEPALCTECVTGEWHGEFDKEQLTGSDFVLGSDGYVYRESEIAKGGYFHGHGIIAVRRESTA